MNEIQVQVLDSQIGQCFAQGHFDVLFAMKGTGQFAYQVQIRA